jgi:hypothetical protein
MWIPRALAASCIVLCAGCVEFPASVEARGSGVTTGRDVQTVHCGSSATLERYLAGAGGVAIAISDGGRRTIYDDLAAVTGQLDDSRDISGAPGVWTFSVDPGGFAGQFAITLSCHAIFVGTAAPEPVR